jgi:two-component system, cell cycle sensor histidine kinase and response regulator CckA
LIPSYNTFLVVLSVLVAMLASFAALDLAARARSESGATRLSWLAGGATVMGLGIWSMHFVGMLAFHLPVPIGYDIPLMLLSMVVAISASLVAFMVIGKPFATLVSGGITMGGGIAGMHYIGMASMRVEASRSYSDSLVVVSVLIAMVASFAALWLAFRFRSGATRRGALLKVLSAVVIGFAIAGMHYTAMAAARFAPGDAFASSGDYILASGQFGGAVAAIAILIIGIALVGAVVDRNMHARATLTRRLSEQASHLAKSEQRTRQILDNALDAVITMSASGAISDWNAQAERMFGIPRAEALGQQMSATIIPERYRDRHDAGLKKFLATGEGPVLNKRIEISALHRDGHEFPIELAISPAKVGELWTFSAFIRDLTEQKKAEEALKQSERALQASERRLIQILETVPLGILVSDEKGLIVFANAGAQKILGKGIVPGIAVAELPEVYQAYLAGTDQLYPIQRMPVVRALTGESATVDDMEIRQGDRVISLTVKSAPILDEEGKIVAAVAAFIDSTERRSLEAQVGQTSKMEAVGQLAGGIAHDFNNLLTVIMSYGAMLVERLDPGEDREDVQEITEAADRAAGLTRQLLAFSRQQVMQPRVLDVNDVIGGLEKMLRRLIGEDVELLMTLDPRVEAINADPGQLEQVLMNLVVNSRDAMPVGGRLTITTSNSELSAESAAGTLHPPAGEYVTLTVSDTGTGMSRAVQQRIFDPFFTTKGQGLGTGLGLATVYGIVKQSGGEIYVYSEVGRGTTFRIYFPRFILGTEERPHEAAPTEVPRGSESILLVEDDSNLRALVARVLRSRGYTVHIAYGGIEALVVASDPATLLDAVITDVVMPGMNGREVVEKLLESRPEMGSLLMSGYTDDDVLRRGVLHGETAFLQKPFTPDQLARKIRTVLDRATIDTAA